MSIPKPCGYLVLIKIPDQEEKSEGGIILPDDLTKKEQDACTTGVIIAFGPTAYQGWEGCKEMGDVMMPRKPHELWGVEIGDTVEFRPFEGMKSSVDEQYRYIPDSQIMGVVDHE